MSHAANIRNRRLQIEQSSVPSKRRKTSSEPGRAPLLNGVQTLTNGVHYPPANFAAVPAKKAKTPGHAQPVESNAKIRAPDEENDVLMADEGASDSADDIDDDEEEGDESDEGLSADEALGAQLDDRDASSEEDENDFGAGVARLTNGYHNDDDEGQEPAEQETPSFADLLRSKGQAIIDVQDLHAAARPLAATGESSNARALTIPTATSLGTVLTQALKTNDVELLESCFQVQNLESIRATIERLQSSHATNLLQRLAERLHKRPGRAGSLMVWVQWTVVAHGGYLASQPAAMKELNTLYQVVRQRATGLQPLLALKGKLDMLEAQMELRRKMQSYANTGLRSLDKVTYIEGQESSSDAEDESPDTRADNTAEVDGLLDNVQRSKQEPVVFVDETDEEDDEAAEGDEDGGTSRRLPNGVGVDGLVEDEEDESDEEDDDDLIDDEAEETGDDDGSELLSDDIDYDDPDGVEDESEDEAPARKR